jgi:hypothetical protein
MNLIETRAARAETIHFISELTADKLDRVAIFESKPTARRGLVHFQRSHDFQHVKSK